MTRRLPYAGRVYTGRDESGRKLYRYTTPSHFRTKRERDKAVQRLRDEIAAGKPETMSVAVYVKRYLAEYERRNKRSSHDRARTALGAFCRDFGRRRMDSVSRIEAKDWAARTSPGTVKLVVSLFNQAIDDEVVGKNPFRGLGGQSKGRGDQPPPTQEQFDALLRGCDALGYHAQQFRALLLFAAYTGMRPGELFALEWEDIDFEAMRIHVRRRVYGGIVDTPKSGHARTIVLTPPAKLALLSLPRVSTLVFRSKRGRRMSQPTLSLYWQQVKASAGVEFDFYHATRHWAAHWMWRTLGVDREVVRHQLGHADAKLLETVYGHSEAGWQAEMDRAFGRNVEPLRRVSGE